MNCTQAQESLEFLLSGKLSGQAARDVRVHLASCMACASRLKLEHWAEVLPALDETIEPSGNFALKFRTKLKHRPEPWWKKFAAWGWSRQIATTGTLAAVILAGILVVRYPLSVRDRPAALNDFGVAENLPLLEDMAVVSNLDLLEDFDTIEALPNLMKEGEIN